jgi:quercetin dioxygenase-like cupin family protein
MAMDTTTTRGCSYVAPDEGEQIRIFDEQVAVKVAGAETGGAYALLTINVAPGGGPPLHAHPGAETFHVLSGEFAFTSRDGDGAATVLGRAGAVVNAPCGVPHRFGATRLAQTAMQGTASL